MTEISVPCLFERDLRFLAARNPEIPMETAISECVALGLGKLREELETLDARVEQQKRMNDEQS